jgi:hypothetical protein
MRKYKSYIFLGIIIILYIGASYPLSNEGGKEKINGIIAKTDSLVRKIDPPEFQKAFQYMDSCLIKDPKLYDNTSFHQKYDRLKTITKIL